jgi:hypothetical protein
MQGGANMASEFFGISSGAYNSSNGSQGVTVSQVDFAGGVLRPAQGHQQGGGMSGHPQIKEHITTLLKTRKIKASTPGFAALVSYADKQINALGKSLQGKKVSAAKLEAVFAKKAFKIFT